jgi:hypothetical protein
MIVAVDFDGTLCHSAWPETSDLDMVGIYTMRLFRRNGGRLILWTCRHDKTLDDAVRACAEAGLEFDAVNANDPQHIKRWEEVHGKSNYSPKVYADIYVDDRSITCYEIPWKKISQYINGPEDEKKFYEYIYGHMDELGGINGILDKWYRYSGRKLNHPKKIVLCDLPLEPFLYMCEEDNV